MRTQVTSMGISTTTHRMVCEWCLLPKFGDNRCVCDRPKFEPMRVCDDYGEFTHIDRLFTEDWDSDDEYCYDCSIRVSIDQ